MRRIFLGSIAPQRCSRPGIYMIVQKSAFRRCRRAKSRCKPKWRRSRRAPRLTPASIRTNWLRVPVSVRASCAISEMVTALDGAPEMQT